MEEELFRESEYEIGSLKGEGSKRKSLNDYEFIEKKGKTESSDVIGKGAYGIVRLAKEKETGKLVAIKMVKRE
jgi:serine/threonine protein kinase